MGLEEEAVFYLLQRAEQEHQLQSVFTHGSIQGWIYLEVTMNNNLLQLLKLTPGVSVHDKEYYDTLLNLVIGLRCSPCTILKLSFKWVTGSE